MKESWVTTSEISWPNIIQKIEIEIELMIWFYENIKKNATLNFQILMLQYLIV